MSALLRLTNLESGSIIIDDIDISRISLYQLRSRISVIPQEPVLFAGTLRFNLDPFNEYNGKEYMLITDADIWDVLERSSLSETVRESNSSLDAVVSENGDNWSAGQRQLICLARAMYLGLIRLRNSKIVLLDEATASVDFATDACIQRAIRHDFKDVTIITIAHRLETISDYDKIIVLSNGTVVESGSPKQLLNMKNSEYSRMFIK